MIKNIESKNELTSLIESNNKYLLDFFAQWCGPCRMQSPILDEIAKKCNSVNILKIDIDNNNEICQMFAIHAVPTLIYFNNGKEIKRWTGLTDKGEIIKTIQ